MSISCLGTHSISMKLESSVAVALESSARPDTGLTRTSTRSKRLNCQTSPMRTSASLGKSLTWAAWTTSISSATSRPGSNAKTTPKSWSSSQSGSKIASTMMKMRLYKTTTTASRWKLKKSKMTICTTGNGTRWIRDLLPLTNPLVSWARALQNKLKRRPPSKWWWWCGPII